MTAALTAILNPRGVAVIGASPDPTKRGHQVVKALVEAGYRGRIVAIHPRGGTLYGVKVVPSLNGVGADVDLAFVALGADAVPGVLRECAAAGIAGAAVPAVGFRESGGRGIALERQLHEVIRETGIRVVGPNTSGLLNTSIGLNLVGARPVRAGAIALLAQSGNVALDVMTTASRWATGLSIYVGVGNETDIAFHEYLEYLDRHPQTTAIMMYVEGFRDGRRFIDVAQRVSVHKPIVLLKGGRSAGGVAAARSHTGSIAGSYPVLRAALRQGGVSEVVRSDELLAVAHTLSAGHVVPAGKGVAVLSDGGGHGTLAADALAELGATLAGLSQHTQRKLRSLLGRAAAVGNPVDIAGAADRQPRVFAEAVDVLVRDRSVGAILLVGLFGGYAVRFADHLADEERAAAEAMVATAAHRRRPLVVHSLYAEVDTPVIRWLREQGTPVVGSLEVASRCIRAIQARGLFLDRRAVPPPAPPPRKTAPGAITAARREHRTTLLETETRELLSEYGVPVADATLCRTADEVLAALPTPARSVALKVVASAVSHKTDAGGVELSVRGKRRALAAFQRIVKSATAYAIARGDAPDIRGVLVSPMLPAPVAELIVGVKRDPQYGPVLTVGAGGVTVEVHHDMALRGLPVGTAEVAEMLQEIRTARVLQGYRGRPAADRDAIVEVVLGVAACALAHPELEELEVNPVFAYPDRAVVVDARAFLHDWTGSDPPV